MAASLDGELKALLAYYGEAPDSPDTPKPEDFFGLISSFSSSLRVSNELESFDREIVVLNYDFYSEMRYRDA